MRRMNTKLAFGLTLFPILAWAHPAELAGGFAGGLTHPFLGADHLLAMMAVGLWAAQVGGRARWQLPAAFLFAVIAGAGLGLVGFAAPALEAGILLSVLLLGLFIVAAIRLPLIASLPLLAGFALLHGMAHGSEMPADSSALPYLSGMALATAMLHALGLATAVLLEKVQLRSLSRAAGAVIVLSGCYLALS